MHPRMRLLSKPIPHMLQGQRNGYWKMWVDGVMGATRNIPSFGSARMEQSHRPTLYGGIFLWRSKTLLITSLFRQAFQRTQSNYKLLVSIITLYLTKHSVSADSLTTRFSVLLRSLVLKPEVWKVLKLHLNSAQNGPPLSEFCTVRIGKSCGGTYRGDRRCRIGPIGSLDWLIGHLMCAGDITFLKVSTRSRLL